MPLPEKDPLTKCYETLWDILEDSADFCTLVREADRIKYTGTARYPERDARQASEWPQVSIEPTHGPADMYCASDGTRVHSRFRVLVRTGDHRLCYVQGSGYQGLFPVQVAILRAMMQWEDRMKLLTWGGQPFVHHCSVSSRQHGQQNPRVDGQQAPVKSGGWTVAWDGELELWFASAGLAA